MEAVWPQQLVSSDSLNSLRLRTGRPQGQDTRHKAGVAGAAPFCGAEFTQAYVLLLTVYLAL